MASDKVAIVTGAARPWGMGRCAAIMLAERGMDIVVVDIKDDWGAEAVAAVKKVGREAIYMKTDVSDRTSVQAMVDHALTIFGRIDVLANVAGVVEQKLIDDITDDHINKIVNVNLKGTIWTCQAVIPVMRRQGGGHIVNTASGGGYQPLNGSLGVYGATKAGVVIFSKNLAWEVAKDNITVISVAPGPTNTAMGADQGPGEGDLERSAQARPMAIGRGLAPEEVAESIVFAATVTNPALTGQVLHANGGSFMA